jgi:hypothetical protein
VATIFMEVLGNTKVARTIATLLPAGSPGDEADGEPGTSDGA